MHYRQALDIGSIRRLMQAWPLSARPRYVVFLEYYLPNSSLFGIRAISD